MSVVLIGIPAILFIVSKRSISVKHQLPAGNAISFFTLEATGEGVQARRQAGVFFLAL
jgi:hypothetical protein